MLTLVPWLLQRPGASVSEAAAAMRATPAQVTSDLRRLDFCGLPGLGGGDLIEVHWFNDRVVLQLADELKRPLRPTIGETVRLLLAAEMVIAASASPPAALVSALDKLRAAAGIPADAVHSVVDPSPWLEQLRDVLAGDRCVEIDYQGREDSAPRARLVDPWQLELLDGHWYLHGRDTDIGEGRVFRLDRISGVVPTEHRRGAVPDTLPTPRYEPGTEQQVSVEVGPGGRWLASALEDVTETIDGDTTTLTFGTDAIGHVATLVLRAAGAAIVREPGELRALVHDHASRALAAYEDARPGRDRHP